MQPTLNVKADSTTTPASPSTATDSTLGLTPSNTGAQPGAKALSAVTNPTPNPAATATGAAALGTTQTKPASTYSSTQVRTSIKNAGATTAAVPAGSASSFDQFSQKVLPNLARPTAPDYVSIYQNQRAQLGIPALEDNLNSLEADIANLKEQQLALKTDKNIAYTMSDYESRIKTANDAIQNAIDSKNLEYTVAQDKLNTKNAIVSNIIRLTKDDYTAANDLYEKTFTENLQMQNAYNLKSYRDMTFGERAQNDARATLNTMYNEVIRSGQTFESWASAPKNSALIGSLETKAGLPQGFFQQFAKVKPSSNIMAIIGAGTSSGTPGTGTQIVSQSSDGTVSTTNVVDASSTSPFDTSSGVIDTTTSAADAAQQAADTNTFLDQIFNSGQ